MPTSKKESVKKTEKAQEVVRVELDINDPKHGNKTYEELVK